ncbi:ankyrin-1-like [Phymastichus coffea]|uniref:ankyrin-1-like n=1 Tax=Phymastichus coffea TaxID=108790 RepID=UPI00273C7392|nr:ankyrin-1-like [Phymastichus coffea]
MELISAIQFQPFEKVKQIAESMKILENSEYLDYHALNLALGLSRKRTANYLISKNCRVNIESKKRENTPLHNAIEFIGDEQIVSDLLKNKASIIAINHEGNTPLHMAFLKRYGKITELILNAIFVHTYYGYENIKNKQDLTHIHIACTMDNERLVQLFLNVGANINDAVNKVSPYYPGYTAMHFAAKNNCINVIKLLMNRGSVKIISQGADSENRTPAQLVFENLKNLQVSFYHMTMQNKNDKSGYYKHLSQFHVACLCDYPDFVENFILHGADINTPIQSEATFCPGYTPLHCAVESNCKKNVEILLQKGANIDQLNYYNMTPLHLALYNEDPNDNNTILDLLYAAVKDKNKNIVDLNGLSYMQIAVTRDDRETVKIFLKNDKAIVNHTVMYNLRNFSGFTALHFAVKYKHLKMAKLLIENGADVNSNDNFEHGTPLHLAFEICHRQLIELLLEHGAKADILRIADNKSMLHLLIENYVNKAEAHALVQMCINNKEANFNEYYDPKRVLAKYVERLVSLGCNVNEIESKNGNTAMHLVCSEDYDDGPYAEELLKFGADINIENFYGQTPFQMAIDRNFSYYMLLFHHVQNLKALELEVNPKNEKCCNEVLKNYYFSFSDKDIVRKHQQRLNEIENMKTFMLDQKVSLYDFVRFKVTLAVVYVFKKPLIKLFEEKDTKELDEKYPTYAYLIKLRYRKTVEYFMINGAPKKIRGVLVKKTGRGKIRK